MTINRFIILFLVFFTLGRPGFAGMESDHFSIDARVISGGGGSMASAQFQTNTTLAQPSPVTPSFSPHFDLLPGFWHTFYTGCPWDFMYDGDVDGLDIYEFIRGMPAYTETEFSHFCLEFGQTDCPN